VRPPAGTTPPMTSATSIVTVGTLIRSMAMASTQ
jgi:hypothetical protein